MSTSAPKQEAAAPVLTLEEYSGGTLDDPLAEIRKAGFDLGVAVEPITIRKEGEEASAPASATYVITAASRTEAGGNKFVKLKDQAGAETVVPLTEFVEHYTIAGAKKKKTREVADGWPQQAGADSDALKVLASKGAIAEALLVGARCAAGVAGDGGIARYVDVLKAPARSVVATREIPPNSLVLTPDTLTVRFTEQTEWDKATPEDRKKMGLKVGLKTQPANDFRSRMMDLAKPGIFTLSPTCNKDFVTPFWIVGGNRVTDAAKCNMAWSTIRVTPTAVLEWNGPFIPAAPPPAAVPPVEANEADAASALASASAAAAAPAGAAKKAAPAVPGKKAKSPPEKPPTPEKPEPPAPEKPPTPEKAAPSPKLPGPVSTGHNAQPNASGCEIVIPILINKRKIDKDEILAIATEGPVAKKAAGALNRVSVSRLVRESPGGAKAKASGTPAKAKAKAPWTGVD